MTIITLTQNNFEEIITTHELIFIDFWAEWCGPCKSFAPIFAEVAKNNPTVTFAKVDIDQEPILAEDFNVRSIPLLVVVKQKVVIFSEAGVLPLSALQSLVLRAQQLDLSAVHKQIEKEEKNAKE